MKETHLRSETQISERNSLVLNPESKKLTLVLEPDPVKEIHLNHENGANG